MKTFHLIIVTLSALVLSMVFAGIAHAADYSVTTTADSGAGSLRQAITDANANPGADTISFAISGNGVHTITPLSPLPEITDQIAIDGTTQVNDDTTQASCGTLVPSLPATNNTPHTLLIEINASNIPNDVFYSNTNNSANTIIKGLILNNGTGQAIGFNADDIIVECNYIGTNSSGTSLVGSFSAGVYIGGNNGLVQNNLISGSSSYGFVASGNTVISNNLIGTNVNGSASLPNASGMNLGSGSIVRNNTISGNNGVGIYSGTTNFSIEGNFIGLSLAGLPLGNNGDGIYLGSTSNFTIGGQTAGKGNVISANNGSGMYIYNQNGNGCPSNIVSQTYGNKIGTNVTGNVAPGYGNAQSGITVNEQEGVSCVSSVYKHKIGGVSSGQPNIIAGNTLDGVRIFQAPNTDVFSISTLGNQIYGNGNLGINLAADSDNDGVADVDLGPNVLNMFAIDYPASYANNYLNRPVITSANTSGNTITVNYNFQAPPSITPSVDGWSLLPTDLVGYQLDFYVNNGSQDGAYAGYAQGSTHLGSFFVDGSETNASHTFTSPVSLGGTQNITATATIVWKNITCQESHNARQGDGPPYLNNCGD